MQFQYLKSQSLDPSKKLHHYNFTQRLSKFQLGKSNINNSGLNDVQKDTSIGDIKKMSSLNRVTNEKVLKSENEQLNKKFLIAEQYKKKSSLSSQRKDQAKSQSLQFPSPKSKLEYNIKFLKKICYQLKLYMDQMYKYFKDIMESLNLKFLYMRHYYDIKLNNYLKQLNHSKTQIQKLKNQIVSLTQTNLHQFNSISDLKNFVLTYNHNLPNEIIKQQIIEYQSYPIIEVEELQNSLSKMRSILSEKLKVVDNNG